MPNPVEVLNHDPVAGSIQPDTVIKFDVRSLPALVRVVVSVKFDGFTFREVAFEGDPAVANPALGFEEVYAPASTVETIVDGLFFRYRFALRRTTVPGAEIWPASPEVRIVAYNEDGLEA